MATIHYLENQFLNQTEGSSKQMQTILEDHYTRLVSRAASDANVWCPSATAK